MRFAALRERIRLTAALWVVTEQEKHTEEMHSLAQRALAAQARSDAQTLEIRRLTAQLRDAGKGRGPGDPETNETGRRPRTYLRSEALTPLTAIQVHALPRGSCVFDETGDRWDRRAESSGLPRTPVIYLRCTDGLAETPESLTAVHTITRRHPNGKGLL